MKRKNLEKAVVLGIILGTSVYGTAWAEDLYVDEPLQSPGHMYSIEPGELEKYDNVTVVADDFGPSWNTDDVTALVVKGSLNVENGGDVKIISHIKDREVMGNNALYVRDNGSVSINADNVYIAAYGGTEGRDAAISAKYGSKVEISGKVVQVIGNIDFINQGSGINNEVTLTLNSKDSFWYGNESQASGDFAQSIVGGGKLNLTLSNGAEWVYDSNGKRYVYELDLGFVKWPINVQSEIDRITSITLDGGVVNLQDDDIKQKYADYIVADDEEYIEHQKVTIENLSGPGGIFKADIDWDTNQGLKQETDNSDYIYILKSDGGTQTLDFDATKANLDKMNIGDKLYFANVKDGNTAFTTVMGDTAEYSAAANVYDYQYGVGSETENNGTDWYIGLTGKSAEGNANVEAAKGAMYAGYALGTELDTLNKRMGEARYLEDDNGVWVRYRHAKTGWDDTFETNSDMFQLGFDNEVQEDDGKHYRGVAIDYTDADTSLNGISGDGEHERYAVSLYDTWLGEKGHYRDLVIRGGRINSDYDLNGMFTDGMHDIGGDYHQWFGSISAEWGRKNDMSKGWYFEPETQLQLARVGGASYVSDSGIEVDQDGATSLIGRVGFRLGREYTKDNGKADNYYFKADLLHEFMGDKAIALTGADGRYENEYDGDETWFDIGLGADISIGKNSYFWADVERTIGADFDNTWQVNGGFRWEF